MEFNGYDKILEGEVKLCDIDFIVRWIRNVWSDAIVEYLSDFKMKKIDIQYFEFPVCNIDELYVYKDKDAFEIYEICDLIKETNVELNILCGNIDLIKDSPIGHLLVDISNADDVPKVLSYLNKRNINCEVIKHG